MYYGEKRLIKAMVGHELTSPDLTNRFTLLYNFVTDRLAYEPLKAKALQIGRASCRERV